MPGSTHPHSQMIFLNHAMKNVKRKQESYERRYTRVEEN